MAIFAPISYLAAALLFAVLAVLVVTAWKQRLQSGLLVSAAVLSAIWAAMQALQSAADVFTTSFLFLVEVLRYGAWLFFLVAILQRAPDTLLSPVLRWAALLIPVVILAVGLFPVDGAGEAGSIVGIGSIILCLIGLGLTERIYTSTDRTLRRPVVYLTIAMLGIFGYDLVMYSSSVLHGELPPGMWVARGVANAMLVPFIAVAARRNRDWPVRMFVSRQVAYFSVTLLGGGAYLVLMSVGAYYVREFGGDWGEAAQAVIIFGAFLLLVIVLLSERFRRNAKVFFAKHFFANRYDYREEWQNLTRALYHADATKSLGQRCIEATLKTFSSESGFILTKGHDDNAPYVLEAAWPKDSADSVSLDADAPLVRFIEQSGWVIDTVQFHDEPGMYGDIEMPNWLLGEQQRLVVPLLQESELIGLLVLTQSTPIALNYEDLDLLKIVGRQVAGVLVQNNASERLAEARQFQAYSRLTAFLMHDLKNLAAQQSLVVKNAAKHKRNPEFVDDAFATIEHSVNRMNALIAQLAERDRKKKQQRVNIAQILNAVLKRTQDRMPAPTPSVGESDVCVMADKDQLFTVFLHLVRNAQDASDEGGKVTVSMILEKDKVLVRVEDRGVGMEEKFIRERLFRPFESTKGVDGMGIGAYQAREYIRDMHGSIEVDSEPGQGTVVTIGLPIVDPAGRASGS